jgi:hypothetical protein
MQQAFNNWSGIGNVNFTVTFSTTPISGSNAYQVYYTTPPDDSTDYGETAGTANGTSPYASTGTYLVTSYINPLITSPEAIMQTLAHEIGHTFGLDDCGNCSPGTSVMAEGVLLPNGQVDYNDTTAGRDGPSQNDMQSSDCDNGYTQNTCYNASNTNNPACAGGTGGTGGSGNGGGPGSCTASTSAPPCMQWNSATCGWMPICMGGNCCGTSPILIDTDHSGFNLTSKAAGVQFDFFGTGQRIQIAWTAPNSTNGWLALDRNGNGKIDGAQELFGNITPQPPSTSPNGYLALAVYDSNGDGVIDNKDTIWPKLLVWIDKNHDGVSQPSELFTLEQIGIHAIYLSYSEHWYVDSFGNVFRYKGHLDPTKGDNVDRVTFDVFLNSK